MGTPQSDFRCEKVEPLDRTCEGSEVGGNSMTQTIPDRFAEFLALYVPRPLRAEAGDVLVKLLLDMRREGGEAMVGKLEEMEA